MERNMSGGVIFCLLCTHRKQGKNEGKQKKTFLKNSSSNGYKHPTCCTEKVLTVLKAWERGGNEFYNFDTLARCIRLSASGNDELKEVDEREIGKQTKKRLTSIDDTHTHT